MQRSSSADNSVQTMRSLHRSAKVWRPLGHQRNVWPLLTRMRRRRTGSLQQRGSAARLPGRNGVMLMAIRPWAAKAAAQRPTDVRRAAVGSVWSSRADRRRLYFKCGVKRDPDVFVLGLGGSAEALQTHRPVMRLGWYICWNVCRCLGTRKDDGRGITAKKQRVSFWGRIVLFLDRGEIGQRWQKNSPTRHS